MEKRKEPIWLQIVSAIFGIILSLAVLVGVGCGIVYYKYHINVFDVLSQIKTLNEPIDMDRLITNAYTSEDSDDAKDIITMDSGSFNITEATLNTFMSGNKLKLTDKQAGAMIDYVIDNQEEIKIQIGEEIDLKDYLLKVMQIDFSNITATTTDFNVVVKLDLGELKKNMTSFPQNWIAKAIPDELYFSSTLTITIGEDFTYMTESKSLFINNLSKDETDSIFNTINTFVKIGSSEEVNKIIGDTFVNMLIGNETSNGLAYGLYNQEPRLITNFNFETVTDGENSTDYLVLAKS